MNTNTAADSVAARKKRTVMQIVPDLEKATKVLASAMDAERAASTARVNALNAVNRLQKEYDEAAEAVRASALDGTDWYSQKHRRFVPSEDVLRVPASQIENYQE